MEQGTDIASLSTNLNALMEEIGRRLTYLELYSFQPIQNLEEICNNVRDAVAEARGRLVELTQE
jgi:hypothetical protein